VSVELRVGTRLG